MQNMLIIKAFENENASLHHFFFDTEKKLI